MKKFNLKQALAGKPVVTADNQEVTCLALIKDAKTPYKVVGAIAGNMDRWTENGRFDNESGLEGDYDLFMKTEKQTGWVNIYDQENPYACRIYPTKQEAIEGADEEKLADTVEITWEG